MGFAQLAFVENKGQWEQEVDFKAEVPSGAFFLQPGGFTVLQHNPSDLTALHELMHGKENTTGKEQDMLRPQSVTVRSHAYRVRFAGGSLSSMHNADKPLDTYNNYFIGADASRWKGHCRLFRGVTYKDVYPNIDVRYYTDQNQLKYDIVVHPGGRVGDIVMEYDGADKVFTKDRKLVISTSVGDLTESEPYSYQAGKAGREEIPCRFRVEKNRVRFVAGDYDPAATLIIDPIIIFCSFTGSAADNWGYTATYGPDGSLFAGGIVYGNGFPVSPGAFDNTFNNTDSWPGDDANGPYDIGIIKLSPDGGSRVYATYLGGRRNEQPHSLFCDRQGNLVVAGRTSSDNFPRQVPLIGPCGAYDIFITRFNASGSDIIGSMVIGGSSDDGVNIKPKFVPLNLPGGINDGAYETRRNYGDDARSEVIIDNSGNIFLASCTQSPDFPSSPGNGIQARFGGGIPGDIQQDGVIIKTDPTLTNVLFSTFFGGSGSDACFVLSVNPVSGNLYVGGATTSSDLPGNTAGVLSPSYRGGFTDGFITQILPNGAGIVKTTYAGTSGNDMLYGIQFDKLGFPYIAGTTTGNWPVINAAFSNPGSKQFIAKLLPDLSAFVYSTVFGTSSDIPNISLTAMLVDRCQNVYVSGWGGGFNNRRGYPCAGTSGMPVTPDATQSATDAKDFYFFVLERNATRQLFGSFFGQNGGFDDHVDGGTSRFDANGIIYQGVCANCGNTPGIFFPTTPGAWAANNGSPGCNQAAVKIEMNFAGVGASVKATINGVFDTVGCVPLTVRFVDTLARAKRYIWHFGDGTPSETTIAPQNFITHTYTRIGSFRLMLVAVDSSTCNITDTAYISVRVGNNAALPDFKAVKVGGCESLTYNFINTTTASVPVYRPDSFLWDFGDGTPKQRAGFGNVTHVYASPGTYDVRLSLTDTFFCNAPVDTVKKVRLAVNVKAGIKTPPRGCVPYTARFENVSLGGLDFTWDFGDGTVTNFNGPFIEHRYNAIGTYPVKLIARDSTTCNKTDTAFFSIEVFPIPTSGFTFSPDPPEENRPVFFTEQSSGANFFKWDFGDGDTSNQANPRHLFNETRTYSVCLIAINTAGCSDTVCKPVTAKVLPLLDVPNAFTPGRFGENGIIRVAGYGIGRMDWRIYNRWGQLVFSTQDRRTGWDGTFKGRLQPMDVYTYTLDVEFTDGKKLRKTGDINLLR
jgi:gliding motility-associated-like protein